MFNHYFVFFGKKCIYSYRRRFKSCYQQVTTRDPETITLKITWISGSLKAGAQSYNQLWNLETRTRTKHYQFRRIWKWLYWMSASDEPAYGNFDWIRCLCVILSSNAMFYIHYVGLIHNNREYDGYTSHFHYKLNIIVFLIKDTLICSGCEMFMFRYNNKSNYFWNNDLRQARSSFTTRYPGHM